MAATTPQPLWRYRAEVASRTLAALAGAYALSSAVAAAGTLLLLRAGLVRADAVAWSTLLALLLLPAVMMGCFACRRQRDAWLGSLGAAVPLAAIVWLLR
ncbi:hypothetical protein CKO44_12505 [Rubrivivax gelatinosus]|uniref:Iron uptake protein n=1 Tax=Rubrivivax gelatinosus TaxID=28068 RepID=A0ABS1E0J4_RUBGE|nr:hypothetical protein [Rubrivivax gelatinosus]MBK1614289.1 hypothetical protein [Rubrivivax gelatinosus]MBK1715601.1 hypothetical protein [Rubrivivax gelatinosus]